MSNYTQEASTDLFDRGRLSDLSPYAPVTMNERRHIVDILFGMVAHVLVSGTTMDQVSPLLNFIADSSDYEWEQASLQSSKGRDPNRRVGSRQERHIANVRAVSVLFYLLHGRPHDANLFGSFVAHCGGMYSAAGWILCCLVNSFDDEIRSFGVRCLADFLEIAAPETDVNVSAEKKDNVRDGVPPTTTGAYRVTHTAKRLSTTISNVGKGLVAIGTGQGLNTILPSSSKPIVTNVVYKLLWHLLKCHRGRVGKKTHASLVYLLLEDRGMDFDCESRLKDLVVSDSLLHSGYKLNAAFFDTLFLDAQTVRGKRLRQTSALNMTMRLLRFLPPMWKEKWLHDLSDLISSHPANVATIVACPEWQASLFHLISDTLEEFHGSTGDQERTGPSDKKAQVIGKAGGDTNGTTKPEVARRSVVGEDTAQTPETESKAIGRSGGLDEIATTPTPFLHDNSRAGARFNLSLKLYGLLLGHCFRQGGDKVSEIKDTIATAIGLLTNKPLDS